MKQYSTIYADPPWQQKAGRPLVKYKVVDGKQVWDGVSNKSRDLSFPQMTVEDICAMPISALVAPDAHLYLWVTNKYMNRFNEVLDAWGFKYSTTHIWCKNMMGGGLGGAYKINAEYLIFATRGSLKAKGTWPGTWHHVKRSYKNGYPQHSKKPEYFRSMIQTVSPGSYLELFARHETTGWDVFGNEVNNSIVI